MDQETIHVLLAGGGRWEREKKLRKLPGFDDESFDNEMLRSHGGSGCSSPVWKEEQGYEEQPRQDHSFEVWLPLVDVGHMHWVDRVNMF